MSTAKLDAANDTKFGDFIPNVHENDPKANELLTNEFEARYSDLKQVFSQQSNMYKEWPSTHPNIKIYLCGTRLNSINNKVIPPAICLTMQFKFTPAECVSFFQSLDEQKDASITIPDSQEQIKVHDKLKYVERLTKKQKFDKYQSVSYIYTQTESLFPSFPEVDSVDLMCVRRNGDSGAWLLLTGSVFHDKKQPTRAYKRFENYCSYMDFELDKVYEDVICPQTGRVLHKIGKNYTKITYVSACMLRGTVVETFIRNQIELLVTKFDRCHRYMSQQKNTN